MSRKVVKTESAKTERKRKKVSENAEEILFEEKMKELGAKRTVLPSGFTVYVTQPVEFVDLSFMKDLLHIE